MKGNAKYFIYLAHITFILNVSNLGLKKTIFALTAGSISTVINIHEQEAKSSKGKLMENFIMELTKINKLRLIIYFCSNSSATQQTL